MTEEDPLLCSFTATEAELRLGATGVLPETWQAF